VATAEEFGQLYARAYRGVLLTVFVLLRDMTAAENVARDAFASRRRLTEDGVRALAVRLARRRLWWRLPSDAETVRRLHVLAGLSATAIASIVDISEEDAAAYLTEAGPVSWASVRQPPVTRVLGRARQRLARRRTLAAAAVAVLVVGVAVPLLRVAPPERVAATPSSRLPTDDPEPGTLLYDISFADARHGHALRAKCGQFDCALELVSTTDGEHWTAREVAKTGRSPGTGGRLFVLGDERVAVDWYPIDDPVQLRRVYSADSGRTWTRVPADVEGTVRSIPAGASLEPACVAAYESCDAAVTVILPDSGRSARLANAPRLARPAAGTVPLDGGRWWVAGRDLTTHRWAVAMSADDGRTWTVTPVPWPGAPADLGWAVAGRGTELLATATGRVDSTGALGVLAIFHSDDGGRTWTKTRGPLPDPVAGTPVAAADGSLLVNTQDGRALRSTDGGRTFTPAAPAFRGVAFWSRSGYVAASGPDHPLQFSSDGLHWRDLRLSPK
jgi:photosystem II stability/assembly factor-like uncharacterized protein